MNKERIIRDSVHSFISFEKNGLINDLIDTDVFQRLKNIRQLGLSYFTYPNAQHTRFSHSLGSFWLAKRVGKKFSMDEEDSKKFSIAALLHDIGHSPFSHVLEGELIDDNHTELTKKIIESEELKISENLEKHGYDPEEISRIIISGTMPKYLHNLISSQLDVDRFDYLLRDSIFTGNIHGRYDIERILHKLKSNENNELFVEKGGWSAVEHYLVCRYQMYKQVYNHSTTLSVEELLKKILKRTNYLYSNASFVPSKIMKPYFENELSIDDFTKISDANILNLVKESKNEDDEILSDLSARFLERNLLKSETIKKKNSSNLFDNKEEILKGIEERDFDTDYYFSKVDSTEKEAYKPYSPNPKDEEEAIYISPDLSKEISEEIESLKEISTPSEFKIFFPEQCREEVRELIN